MATANGELVCPEYLGEKTAQLSIYRRADAPSMTPEYWRNFCEYRYDYESRARWGRW
ncbi:uncharacterized protein ASPGLDRAFT_53267 [Aspergillus glaucus CBS 516.65]|uniref:Uncharacterized protein n=1 Tax=Aspergillus glaucus CBS 516.65 TaxID=1160497 RepID=A0A1L9V4F9_ASPGL|nr:hypothetical protein ASPGLDRAFT_53267 [Aspergillus glaucus CBS 516.65]OJJ78833.1 hypothetical protein ASPGLDRAFT_53267 [Aspergillus glaucus CBS 516.65]